MYIANELTLTKKNEYIDEIRESMIENLFLIIEKFFSDKTMFSMDNFTIHILDEYVLETNCTDDIFTNIYIEIDQPNNYKPEQKQSKNQKYVIPELYIKLSDIKKGLFETTLKHFDNNSIVWQDKFAICIRSTVKIDDTSTKAFYFRIIPALTYYNSSNIKGLVYYINNDIQIEYPEKFTNNYLKKNKETKDKFRETILIFKNILLKDKTINQLPSEIIETLVYNVPSSMFKSTNKDDIINIINFIRNNSIKSFRTIDEQDYAFASVYRGMSLFYCNRILKLIENYLIKS